MWFPPLSVPPTLKIGTLISGCSRHIIGNSLFSTDLKERKTGEVTFGDVIQGKFIARIKKNHPTSSIIGDISNGIIARKKSRPNYAKMSANVYFTSTVEPTNVTGAMKDEQWIKSMQEELVQFEQNQIEGVDFGETFAPVARLEAIRLLLSLACVTQITLFHMDVKTAFLNGYILEEVFVAQPKDLSDLINPDYVCKALYGLKQAP
ncbi:gag-pol polyprotein [Cucumis melo var. makuwa]|uniref:Gag-pol polyprotein n=1 Tax=Cucumis melo var. makuwa TaxID=1194695 RepID=A0A5D3DGI4_CUCMM|nr:gag-pol polyprotein [Cucumis melo var. makuwa]